MSETNEDVALLKRSFNKVLNSHGYAFQYAVLQQAEVALSTRNSQWVFEAAEVPVVAGNAPTRIDFVLRRTQLAGEPDSPFYMVAECKRANPSLSNWCFVRAPYVVRNRSHEPFILEHVERDEKGLSTIGIPLFVLQNAFHVALEVKSGKGENSAQGRGAVEEAATQVCRGLNGLIMAETRLRNPVVQNSDFLPVIFTTANLWTTDANLGETELTSGDIDLDKESFEQQPWVVLQYHMSPALKHPFPPKSATRDFAKLMDLEFIRSIPVVNATAIPQFLRWASQLDRIHP